MKWSSVFLSAVLICSLVVLSGCTQSGTTGSAVKTEPSVSAAIPLDTLALTAADAPPGYSLSESRAKTEDEVGTMAKDLGWQGGYLVRFTGPSNDLAGPTGITQTITSYPAGQMPEIIALVGKNDQSDNELVITILPSPGIGDFCSAFSGKAIGQIVVRPDTKNPLKTTTATGTLKQDMVEIIFYRGSTLEVFRMTGPDANITVLKDLAEKAYAQIP